MQNDRVLVLTRDGDLLDELLRMAAAAGCEVERLPDAVAARKPWKTTPLVVLDAVSVIEVAEASLPRRAGVVVVCVSPPAEDVWRCAVTLGACAVLMVPRDEDRIVAAFADAVERPSRRGTVLAVLGGRGGAGASVFATALARVSAGRSERVLLMDGDPAGGGLDLLLGAEERTGLRWSGLGTVGGRLAATTLRAALPSQEIGDGTVTVLSCDRADGGGPTTDGVEAVVTTACRSGDTVVCDLPRSLPAPAIAALTKADLAVIVVPAEVRACASAAALLARLRVHDPPLRLVVRGPSPGGLTSGDVQRALGVPVAAAMRPEPGLAAALEHGGLRMRSDGPLAKSAATVLDLVRQNGPRGAT
ncbi:secretion/DNA translocation related CpaE-like protein [Actinoalloteichus hoggarensis]|uniref:Cell division inhibitor MinD n=1 Tax=Actinoalloteichus hoggarensis TaxID=1470176 RepID=A0A221VWQ5_9PSEU|nr:septum site-determining protein Ssd [Actinoalloteichus hoggarensis]ASO17934.1 cell division inhibitor MinD [Actinoalloteichus hoggarensis]MBB5924346.1 secretion/DNA translocation related CpaE-like protein [Actinoalloteichus hoggarensis]